MKTNQLIIRKISMAIMLVGIFVFSVSCSKTESEKAYLLGNESTDFIRFKNEKNAFAIAQNGEIATLVVANEDYIGVKKALEYFKTDLKNVTGLEATIVYDNIPSAKNIVLVGTLGKSSLINQLVAEKKINVADINGKWENSLIQVVKNPFVGVENALVIVGSDKRGTMFGVFDISRKMGVSPWYWWADVPVVKNENIYVKNGRYNLGEPKVKYRGIFLNDEEPALGHWAVEKYGGFNHQFYEKVFELMLRLKSNYIWPAMWWASFNADDPLNAQMADDMGIVLGTSHHEPMDRAHAEWKAKEVKGAWDYETNTVELREFWREGIERIGEREVIVNMAMRGDGDVEMSDEANTVLLEKIVSDQRQIIEEVTGNPAEKTPQMWALYKEVQEYYDEGMRVPDDVTLMLCDDNWGNLRKLPSPNDSKRDGGYAIYYHFDFVGGPRSYKWLNVSPLPRVWEQMNLAYRHGVDRLWLVNVGDLKPMELPISFFLDFAWDPDRITVNEIDNYTTLWAAEQFGEKYASDAAEILDLYTKYNGRRTPEMLYSNTFSVVDFREFETVTADYTALAEKAEQIYNSMSAEMQPAFYQLAYQPALACANLYEMYYAHALNLMYAKQGRAATTEMAQKVQKHFEIDAEITEFYHTKLVDGKWNHMMAQPRIGYYSWQQPPYSIMPKVSDVQLDENALMGIAVEGNKNAWPGAESEAKLPAFDSYNNQSFYIEVFNKGIKPFDFNLTSTSDWIKFSKNRGEINTQQRIEVSIDWTKAKAGDNKAEIAIESSNNERQIVLVEATKIDNAVRPKGHLERNGYVSIDATKYTEAVNSNGINWDVIPGMGRTGSSITTFPVTKSVEKPGKGTPLLKYDFFLLNKPVNQKVKVKVFISPLLNFKGGEGLKFAVSVDNGEPTMVNIHDGTEVADWRYPQWFNSAVGEKIMVRSVELELQEEGQHNLKLWMVDNAVVYQKIVIETESVPFSYLGPPESLYFK